MQDTEQNAWLLFTSSGEPPRQDFLGKLSCGGWARVKQDVTTEPPCPLGAAWRSSLDVILGPPFLVCQCQGPFSCPRLGVVVGIDGFLPPGTPLLFHISCSHAELGKELGRVAPLRDPQSTCVSTSTPQFFPLGHGQSPEGCWVSCEPGFRKRWWIHRMMCRSVWLGQAPRPVLPLPWLSDLPNCTPMRLRSTLT